MPDPSQKEKIAELEIASLLSARSLLIAKPYFDQRGADLLGLLHICGGAKFCRIQSKYRQEESSVEVPICYVAGAFVCLVYVVPNPQCSSDPTSRALFCFFPDDIRNWTKRDGNHVLWIPKFETCKVRFGDNLLNDKSFEKLRRLIADSTIQDEMGMLDFSNPNNSGLIPALF